MQIFLPELGKQIQEERDHSLFELSAGSNNRESTVNINRNTLITMSFPPIYMFLYDELSRLTVGNPKSTFCRVISSFSFFGTAREKAPVF